MGQVINPKQYDKHVPSWVKALIGTLAAIIFVPSISFIAVVKLGGVEDIMQSWAKQQLKVSEPVINSNKELAIQILELNNTIHTFKNEMRENSEVMNERLSAVEDTLTIHSAQIQSGLQALQSVQQWASEHSENGNVDYAK